MSWNRFREFLRDKCETIIILWIGRYYRIYEENFNIYNIGRDTDLKRVRTGNDYLKTDTESFKMSHVQQESWGLKWHWPIRSIIEKDSPKVNSRSKNEWVFRKWLETWRIIGGKLPRILLDFYHHWEFLPKIEKNELGFVNANLLLKYSSAFPLQNSWKIANFDFQRFYCIFLVTRRKRRGNKMNDSNCLEKMHKFI